MRIYNKLKIIWRHTTTPTTDNIPIAEYNEEFSSTKLWEFYFFHKFIIILMNKGNINID